MINTKYEEYIYRINLVLDHIEKNLQNNFTLEELSKVAGFSKYHFHRIFSSLVGETLFSYIQRLRLEKAAQLLIADRRKSVTEISYECGFSSPALFSRIFKNTYSMSPSSWKEKCNSNESKIDSNLGKLLRNNWKDYNNSLQYNIYEESKNWRDSMNHIETDVKVKKLPETDVAYIRYIGNYKGNEKVFEELFSKICKWAGPRGLINETAQFIAIYHDNPEITDDDKLRVSVCITIGKNTEVSGEIGKLTLPESDYAIGHFEISADQYQEAWNYMCGVWMPQSGYQPDDKLPFEKMLNDPREHPEGKHIIEICIPVKPL